MRGHDFQLLNRLFEPMMHPMQLLVNHPELQLRQCRLLQHGLQEERNEERREIIRTFSSNQNKHDTICY